MSRGARRLILASGALLVGACWSGIDFGGGSSGDDGSSNTAGCGGAPAPPPPCNAPDPDTPSQPPGRPTSHAEAGATRWYVLRSVRFGQSDVDGSRDSCAWKSIGFDLDGRDTTPDDSADNRDTCRRVSGSARGILADGVNGIDNNFGAHMMATAQSVNDGPTDGGVGPRPIDVQVSDAFAHGAETLLLRIDNLFDDRDEASAPGALYETASLGTDPGWMNAWPVYADSLVDGVDLAQPLVTFPDGYLSGDTWVSGPATVRFELPTHWGGNPDERIGWAIDAGLFAFRLRTGTGVLAGAIAVDTIEPAVRPISELFGICPGNATYDQTVRTLGQSADLVLGAPQLQDPSRDCDAISVGIGIRMVPAVPPELVVPRATPEPSKLCDDADAGAGD